MVFYEGNYYPRKAQDINSNRPREGAIMITIEQTAVLIKANLVLNIVSGLCGITVVLIIVLFWWRDPELMDRVSIRLNMGISLVDFLKAMAILVYTKFKTDNYICVGLSFSIYWLTLVYLFLNAMIALNLQLVFLCALPNNPSWEPKYWALSMSLPTLIMMIPLFSNKLGLDKATSSCDFRDSLSLTSYLLLWGCLLFWIFVVCLYCTVIVILTILSLRKKACYLDKVVVTNSHIQTCELAKVKYDLRALIRRVTLYCIFPIMTQLSFAVSRIYEFHSSDENFALGLLSVVTTDIPGMLNLIAFLMDPAFINACRKLYSNSRVDSKSEHLINSAQSVHGQRDSIDLPTFTDADSSFYQPTNSNRRFELNPIVNHNQLLITRFVKRL